MKKTFITAAPVVLGAVILAVMIAFVMRDWTLVARKTDLPPTIEFTWSPAGAISLKEMRGHLSIHDDYALDFKTYRMHIEELDKIIDLPIEGLIGKDYEQDISFSLLADNPKVIGKDKLTIVISIADDRGQKTSIVRVIPLKQ